MVNPFGNKLPDAGGFANDQAKNVAGNKFNDVKNLGESKLNDVKNLGESKLNDAKNLGEGKLNDLKNLGESKLNDVKNLGEGKLNDLKNLGEGKLNDLKNLGEGKLNDLKNLGKNFTSSFSAGGFGSNKASTPAGVDNKDVGLQSKTPLQDGDNKGVSPQAESPVSGSASPAAENAGANKDKGATEPKLYVVRSGDDLGSIAKKFNLPSWKYLYQLNKDKIGDNPDLLKVATKLTIPQWDTTSGDEMIREKKADPFAYTGGLQYRYPWVPLSVTLTDINGNLYKERNESGQETENFEKEKEYIIIDAVNQKELHKGKIKRADELELLIPDVKKWLLKIDGIVYSK